jgi:hypothetical protein
MFEITFHDRNGTELKEGDVVALSDGKALRFYCEVKWIEAENIMAPWHTFSFHSVEKADKLPDGLTLSDETRYKCWYHNDPAEDNASGSFEHYRMEWLTCEREIDKRVFRIKRINKIETGQQKLF